MNKASRNQIKMVRKALEYSASKKSEWTRRIVKILKNLEKSDMGFVLVNQQELDALTRLRGITIEGKVLRTTKGTFYFAIIPPSDSENEK